uniref:NR LBD domain-containing protein n=1 Tax=Panagrolaimus sp. JU765 TaxID=591449 RepID=A0AC34RTB3_9BILA
MAEVHMNFHPQQMQLKQEYSPPSIACPLPYELYPSSVSSSSTIPYSAPIHVIAQGNTPPPSYSVPQLAHPLAGTALLSYPPQQNIIGGAAAPAVANHNGYSMAQTGSHPSSSGSFPELMTPHGQEALISQHAIINEDVTIASVYEQHLFKCFKDVDLSIFRSSAFFSNITRTEGWLRFAEELTKIIQLIIEFAKNINGFACLDQNEQIVLFAEELTKIIQLIIEFAKNINGFACLDQNEQIVLLKKNSFDMFLVILSQFYNIDQDSLDINGILIPVTSTLSTWSPDTNEAILVNDIMNCVRNLASFHLTLAETALFCALVLVHENEYKNPNQYNFVNRIQQLLNQHLSHRTNDETMIQKLLAFHPTFQRLSQFHMYCLNEFKKLPNQIKLPELYNELFS